MRGLTKTWDKTVQSSEIVYNYPPKGRWIVVDIYRDAKRRIHVQYTRTESDRLGYATVRLTESPIARDLEKYTEVFTEGVKCWRIDSIGHGRTRPVSLCVGSTERKSDRERLRKIHWSAYRGCKMLADRLHRTRTDTTRLSLCRFDWAEVRSRET